MFKKSKHNNWTLIETKEIMFNDVKVNIEILNYNPKPLSEFQKKCQKWIFKFWGYNLL